MALNLQVEPGGQYLVPFVKKKIHQWHAEMLHSGQRSLSHTVAVTDGSRIYVSMVLISNGVFLDKVRITVQSAQSGLFEIVNPASLPTITTPAPEVAAAQAAFDAALAAFNVGFTAFDGGVDIFAYIGTPEGADLLNAAQAASDALVAATSAFPPTVTHTIDPALLDSTKTNYLLVPPSISALPDSAANPALLVNPSFAKQRAADYADIAKYMLPAVTLNGDVIRFAYFPSVKNGTLCVVRWDAFVGDDGINDHVKFCWISNVKNKKGTSAFDAYVLPETAALPAGSDFKIARRKILYFGPVYTGPASWGAVGDGTYSPFMPQIETTGSISVPVVSYTTVQVAPSDKDATLVTLRVYDPDGGAADKISYPVLPARAAAPAVFSAELNRMNGAVSVRSGNVYFMAVSHSHVNTAGSTVSSTLTVLSESGSVFADAFGTVDIAPLGFLHNGVGYSLPYSRGDTSDVYVRTTAGSALLFNASIGTMLIDYPRHALNSAGVFALATVSQNQGAEAAGIYWTVQIGSAAQFRRLVSAPATLGNASGINPSLACTWTPDDRYVLAIRGTTCAVFRSDGTLIYEAAGGNVSNPQSFAVLDDGSPQVVGAVTTYRYRWVSVNPTSVRDGAFTVAEPAGTVTIDAGTAVARSWTGLFSGAIDDTRI